MANEPDLIQKLSVDFNIIGDISVDFSASPVPIDAEFGNVYVVGGDCKVLYASTATWNSQPQLISARGYIYIYSDYRQNDQEQNVAAIKVGDGTSYLIDMPFTDELLYSHVADNSIHVTSSDKDNWNNKVRCYVDPLNEHRLIFTTN